MFTLNCKGRLLVIDRPIVMGIINTTPDSFYPASRHTGNSAVADRAGQMLEEGATILDIGGQSTRPGSTKLSVEEEMERVIKPLAAIHQQFPEAIISIDTYYSAVAREAVACGASIINDISAGSIDEEMLAAAASLQVPYILTHMKGNPQTMHEHANYAGVTQEVLDFFIKKTSELKKTGVHDIIIDPGFGFAKTAVHNFELLRTLGIFSMLDTPLLLGVSRKGTIYKTLGVTSAEALNGSTVLHTIGLLNGANILRVHDVREAMEAVKLVDAYTS